EALRQDIDWIREHTRLGDIASRWHERGRPESFLGRGEALESWQAWAKQRKANAPEITDLLLAFLNASAEAETARASKERQNLMEIARAQRVTARSQRRASWLLWGITAMVLVLMGNVVLQDYDLAKRETNVFSARASDALASQQFDRALRYALQGYRA